MGFLSSAFESKALIRAGYDRNPIPRATGGSVSSYGDGIPLGPPGKWDIDQAMNYAVDQVMWVFRCVDVIAQNQSSLPLRLRNGNDSSEGEWIEDPMLFRMLNSRANTYESATQFRYRLSANLLLSRRGAYVELVRDSIGRVRELHILPSSRVEPIADNRIFVSGYRVHRSDNGYDDLPPEDVIWLKLKPHPTDPYQQMTPITSLGLNIMTDWLAQQFNQTYLANGGRQGLLVAIKGELDKDDAEEMRRRFSGGPRNAGEATVIEAEGISVQEMSGRPSDIQWSSLLDLTKNAILMGFGVPESVMGNASGRTFDNAEAERENFWMDTMVPHANAIASGLDALTGDTDDNVVLAMDYKGIDVLQRQARRDREEARAEVGMGLLTIDEYLTKSGREAWNVTGTSVLFNSIPGSVIAKDDKTRDKVKEDIIMMNAAPEPEEEEEAPEEQGGLIPRPGSRRKADPQEDDTSRGERMSRKTLVSDQLRTKALAMGGGAVPKA